MKFSPGYWSLEGQTLRKLKPVRFDFTKVSQVERLVIFFHQSLGGETRRC
jgi:hypothetical protein